MIHRRAWASTLAVCAALAAVACSSVDNPRQAGAATGSGTGAGSAGAGGTGGADTGWRPQRQLPTQPDVPRAGDAPDIGAYELAGAR